MKITKKNLSLCLGLAFLSLMGCQDRTKKGDSEAETPQESSEMVEEPTGIISLKEAKSLCDNYENRRAKTIIEFEMAQNDSVQSFVPTQFIDFDLKTIKQYIKFVEAQAQKAKVEPDSLRIYLANYGPEGRDPNRNTVFVLPTTTIDGDHGGFYIDDDGNAQLIRNYWPKNQKGSRDDEPKSKASLMPSLNTLLYQQQSLIMNYGTGGPPPTGDF